MNSGASPPQPREHGIQQVDPGSERAGRQRHPDAPAFEHGVDILGASPSSASGPHAAKGSPSAPTPSRWASIRMRASSRGSASMPSGLESAISAQSTPSRCSSAARRCGRSLSRSTTVGISPERWIVHRPSSPRANGRRERRSSASTNGSVQRCWCTSIRIPRSILYISDPLYEESLFYESPKRRRRPPRACDLRAGGRRRRGLRALARASPHAAQPL